MFFKTACPSCRKALQVPDAALGKRGKCPACGHAWQISKPVPVVAPVLAPEPTPVKARFDELMADSLTSTAAPAPKTAMQKRTPPAAGWSGDRLLQRTGAERRVVVSRGRGDRTPEDEARKGAGKKGVKLVWANESESPDVVIQASSGLTKATNFCGT